MQFFNSKASCLRNPDNFYHLSPVEKFMISIFTPSWFNVALYSLWFSFKLFAEQGNTAVYLLYANARICSIITKSGRDIAELKKVNLFHT